MANTAADCESFFQDKINSILLTTSWVDPVKALLNMAAVSQIWGDVPAWYIWLEQAEGVYELQLAEAMTEDGQKEVKQGVFCLKCYPHPEKNIFQAFSAEEQWLAQSRFFDDTGTPRFEERASIPDSLFNVAAVEFRTREEKQTACLTLQSLELMRSVYPDETMLNSDLTGKSRHYSKGETCRAVPGWKLSYPLFDRLVCMYSFYSKTKPVRLRITRSPGFEYVHNGQHGFACVDTKEVHQLTASVFFAPQGEPIAGCMGHGFDLMPPAEDQDEQEILMDWEFTCGHCHALRHSIPGVIDEDTRINESWWSLAETEYQSSLTSTCGCH